VDGSIRAFPMALHAICQNIFQGHEMSSFNSFSKLIEEFCALAGMEKPAAVVAGEVFAVNGAPMKIAYSEEVAPAFLFVYCDYGEVPLALAAQVYERLMRWNTAINLGVSPSYGMSADGRNILYTYPFMIEDGKPDVLWQAVTCISDGLKLWRENNYFVDTQQQTPVVANEAARANMSSLEEQMLANMGFIVR